MHILCAITIFENHAVYDTYKVEIYCRSGQATGDNMMQALYMLDIYLFIIYIPWIFWDKE
jgi:hypothetical protein